MTALYRTPSGALSPSEEGAPATATEGGDLQQIGVGYVHQVDIQAKTDRFFRLLEAGDADGVAAMCAPNAVFGKNNEAEVDPAALREHIAGIVALGISVTYDGVRRITAANAVVDEHIARMRHPDGREATGSACIILRFDDDGMILRLDEYIDGRPFAPLFK